MNCTVLYEVTCYAVEPPALGSYCFYRIPSPSVLYVPAASVGKYKAADGWMDFSSILAIDVGTYVEETEIEHATLSPDGNSLTVTGAAEGTAVRLYSMNGACIGESNITAGAATFDTSSISHQFVIVKMGGKAIKVMIK